MQIILYILAILGLIFIILMFWLGKTTAKVKKELSNKSREFTDIPDLVSFIRSVFKCTLEHRVVMYGFVETVFEDNLLPESGLADEPSLNVGVILITNKGHEKIDTTCGNITANLKKGDFVAVLPFYNNRHNFWYYVTIAKLKTVYLGKDRGFLVEEQYVD